MTTTLSPLAKQKFFDNNGAPLAKGLLFTYQAGTTTKLATYTDSTGGTPNSNPIVLDYRGECNAWIAPNVGYKYVLAPANDTDPPTNAIWTVDNVVNSQLITLYGGVDTGSANAYILTFTANFSAYADGIVIYWLPSHTNTAGSTINVNGLGIVNILNQDGTALYAGQIRTNQFTTIIMRSGAFYIISNPFSSGSFTATLTGMTAATTATVNYSISGNLVSLNCPAGCLGTSNSAAMTMTGMPAVITPNASIVYGFSPNMVNNAFIVYGSMNIIAGVMTLSPFVSNGAAVNYIQIGPWTAAGTKGLFSGWSVIYPLN